MKNPTLTSTSQSKTNHVRFGEICESGYSTTTSSEEGNLQVFEKAEKRLEERNRIMVTKESNMEVERTKRIQGKNPRRRSRANYFARGSSTSPSSQSSPYSSTSSLTQLSNGRDDGNMTLQNVTSSNAKTLKPIPASMRHGILTSSNNQRVLRHHNYVMRQLTRSQENLANLSGADDQEFQYAESSGEVRHQGDDDINTAAMTKFRVSMEQLKNLDKEVESDQPIGPDYYLVGDGGSYYDPLEITDPGKKQIVIQDAAHPSIVKERSPARGILKHLNQPGCSQQHSSSSSNSTPVKKHHQRSMKLSKSEENLSDMRKFSPISPPAAALSPPGHKSAFVAVKSRPVPRAVVQEGPVIAVHPPVQELVLNQAVDIDYDEEGQQRSNQTLQMQITPRVSGMPVHAPMAYMHYVPLQPQLRNIHAMISQEYNIDMEKRMNDVSMTQPIRSDAIIDQRDGTIYFPQITHQQNGVNLRNNGGSQKPKGILVNGKGGRTENLQDHSHQEEQRNPQLPSAETLSNEAVRLKQYLKITNPQELKTKLQKIIETKDPGLIDAMSKLFPGSEFTSDAAHCVRCHKVS